MWVLGLPLYYVREIYDRDVMQSSHPWIDGSQAPLFVLRIPKLRQPGELEAAMAATHQITKRAGGPIAWVVDGSALVGANAKERRVMVHHEEVNRPYAQKFNVGMAVVAPTAVVRGMYTAITWLAPPVYPSRVVKTFEEAEAWTVAQLREAGVFVLPRKGTATG